MGPGILKQHCSESHSRWGVRAWLSLASFLPARLHHGLCLPKGKGAGGKFRWPLVMQTGLASLSPRAGVDAGWGSRARGVRVSLPAWLGPTHLATENLFSNLSLAHPPSPTPTKWQDVPGIAGPCLTDVHIWALALCHFRLDFNSREEKGGNCGAEWISGLDSVLFLFPN